MKFADIPLHEEAKARLRQMVDTGRIPHALLIEGPSGTGKVHARTRLRAVYTAPTGVTATAAECARRAGSIRSSTHRHGVFPSPW